jgi:hypothetical protein
MNTYKQHLTQQQLIEYQFKLASQAGSVEIAAHLAGCSDCRDKLERMNRKFSSLDMLREQFEVSEDLISKVVEQAKKPVRARIFFITKPVWVGVAAAVLIIASLLAVNLNQKQGNEKTRTTEPPEIVVSKDGEVPSLDSSKFPAADQFKTESSERLIAGAGLRAPSAELQATSHEPLATSDEPPPFAPASAIELVTLPKRDKVQLTIYNSADLTLVRERRNLTLKKGWNWLQFMWANTLIDPTSLSLEPLEQKDKIDIQQLVFPARLRDIGRWLIHSDFSGQAPFEITYFTSGLSWRAFYMGTLSEDEKKMRLEGYVRVGNNSGEDYEDAQTRLLVGQVHILDQIAELARRQYPYNSPVLTEHNSILLRDKKADGDKSNWSMITTDTYTPPWVEIKEIIKEGLSEYFLYTIEGTETIPDKWGKRLLSFEADDVNIVSLYKYDEERFGQDTIRYISFSNDSKHNLGKTPIPDGDVKVYGLADKQGNLSYVGGTNIKYIPVNEEVELNLGPARLVEIDPTLMDYKTDNFMFDPDGNITGWDEIRTWKMEIKNTRTLPVSIEITRGFGTPAWTLQSDTPYEKYDATHVRFKMIVQPRAKREFEYTVRTYHGIREDTYAKIGKAGNAQQ